MINMKKYCLKKTVRIGDPYLWYGRDTITAEMWRLNNSDTVRVAFLSIDDKMIYQDFSEWDLDSNWEWCKKWLWDRMPDAVSAQWMYICGYRPF